MAVQTKKSTAAFMVSRFNQTEGQMAVGTGFVQRYKGKIKAQIIALGSGGIVDANGNSILGGTTNDAVVAHAGGTRALATQLACGWNRIATCATGADSVALPAAKAGNSVLVINDGAAAAQVFAKVATTDTIDGIVAATGVVLTNAKRAWFYCLTDGKWQSLMGVPSA